MSANEMNVWGQSVMYPIIFIIYLTKKKKKISESK